MEQEQIDERMLKGGVVPVSDEIHRLPAAANGTRKPLLFKGPITGCCSRLTSNAVVKGKSTKEQPEEEDEEAELAKLQAEMAM